MSTSVLETRNLIGSERSIALMRVTASATTSSVSNCELVGRLLRDLAPTARLKMGSLQDLLLQLELDLVLLQVDDPAGELTPVSSSISFWRSPANFEKSSWAMTVTRLMSSTRHRSPLSMTGRRSPRPICWRLRISDLPSWRLQIVKTLGLSQPSTSAEWLKMKRSGSSKLEQLLLVLHDPLEGALGVLRVAAEGDVLRDALGSRGEVAVVDVVDVGHVERTEATVAS